MTKNQKQFVSLIIVLTLLFAGVAAIGMADVGLTEDEVRASIANIQQTQYSDGSYFESEGFAGASTCYGFAKKIQYLVFGNIVSWNYDGTAGDGLNLIDRVDYPFTADKMQSLMSQAKVGDLIQMDRGTIKCQHSMIFGGLTSNGFIIYDANWEPYNEVDLRVEPYDAYLDRDHAHISLLRNTRYSDAPADTEAPVVSAPEVTNQTDLSYTVKVTVSDNVGVTSVKMPTWTVANGQDDLIWHEATISGNTATYTVNTADHKNEKGTYITHVYVYDRAGNYVSVGTTVDMSNQEKTETSTSLTTKASEEKNETVVVEEVSKTTDATPMMTSDINETVDEGTEMNPVLVTSDNVSNEEQKDEVIETTENGLQTNSSQNSETIEENENQTVSNDIQQENPAYSKENVNTGFNTTDFCVAAFVALALIIAVRLIAYMVQRKNG